MDFTDSIMATIHRRNHHQNVTTEKFIYYGNNHNSSNFFHFRFFFLYSLVCDGSIVFPVVSPFLKITVSLYVSSILQFAFALFYNSIY